MNFFNNILNKATKAVTLEDKIFTVSIDKLHFDEDYKAVFKQEEDKVQRIAEDMKANGFDKSQPIILDENYAILDGNSRYMACQIAGITKVPVIIKKFESRDETIEYEYKMQLNSRRLTDGEYFVTVEDKDNSETYSLNDILVEMEGNIINLTSDTKE